jgi:hypothetical protein
VTGTEDGNHCWALYPNSRPGDRIVHCGLVAGHDGLHAEDPGAPEWEDAAPKARPLNTTETQQVIKRELWARLDEVMRPEGSMHQLDIGPTTLGDWLGDRVYAALVDAEARPAHWGSVADLQAAYSELAAKLDEAETAMVKAEAERDAMRPAVDLLREMVDDDPCDYDHHDYCQTHHLSSRPCANARALALIAAVDAPDENRESRFTTAPGLPVDIRIQHVQTAYGTEIQIYQNSGANITIPNGTWTTVGRPE